MLKKIWRDIRLNFVSEYKQRKIIVDHLTRFPEHHQGAVLTLAARHDRLAELAASFPALLFALAITRNEPCAKEVSQGIMNGMPLADLAEIGSVPLWLRKLPPEAFISRIPELPNDDDFRRRIGNHLPTSPAHAATWLKSVGEANKWCDPDFAVWVARVINENPDMELNSKLLFRMALYAWFSKHIDTEAGKLIKSRWNKKMTSTAAFDGLDSWREDLRVHLLLDGVTPEQPWIAPMEDGPYTFTPILTADQLIAESLAMNNCLRGYAEEIATRETQFWVVHKNAERVAHLSIGHRWQEPLPSITEIRGPNNEEVTADVYRVAWQWFIAANLEDLRPKERTLKETPINHKVWARFWRPYWLAKKRLPRRLPLAPSFDQI